MMGYLLIPLQRGLFEARVACRDQMTGYRESFFVAQQLTAPQMQEPQTVNPDPKLNLEQVVRSLRQIDFDDPRHDEAFPQHSLSRTRAALRWLCGESDLRVMEWPSAVESGEVELSHLDCALRPPPRFVCEPPKGRSLEADFRRVSFCGTDGVETVRLRRWEGFERLSATALRDLAESHARRLNAASGVLDASETVEVLPSLDQQVRVLVMMEGTGQSGSPRHAMVWFNDQHRRVWSLSQFGTTVVPRAMLSADLIEAVRSFRLLRPPPRPWWKLW